MLTAIKLAKHAEVVGISAKPGLVSGQELGWRLSRPGEWARHNWIPFDKFRGLDRVRTVQGTLTGVDLAAGKVFLDRPDGIAAVEPYDALVISTGVTNGFWRKPELQSADEIVAGLRAAHDRLATAESVIVIGGGAAAVSSAYNVARTWPGKRVELYFPGERALEHHHTRAWERVRSQAREGRGALHPGHRAVIPEGFECDDITGTPVEFSTGQPPGIRRRRAMGDRSRSAQHGLVAGRNSRRARIRSRHARAEGPRSPRRVRDRRRRCHRSASYLGTQPRGRAARAKHFGRVRRSATSAPSVPRVGGGVRSSESSPTVSRSSRRTESPSDSPHGRSNGS